MNYSVNLYSNIKNPRIGQTITINQWFDLIKHSDHSSTIISARNGHIAYDYTKSSLSAITYNFLFEEKKANTNITSPTGLMFIDVDIKNNQNAGFDITQIDLTKVFCYYHSFGGSGYCIVVKVNNLTIENFDDTYIHICNELNIPYDKAAKKPTQYSILSHDPNIYVNDNCFAFDSIDICSHHPITKRKEVYRCDGNISEKNIKTSPESLNRIRYNNIRDFNFNGKSDLYHYDKFDIVEAKFPKKILTGNRNSTLVSYCTNLVWLNPNKSITEVMNILLSINKSYCLEPLGDNQIKKVVHSVFKYKHENRLSPTFTKRTTIFNPNLSKEEKISLNIARIAERKRNKSLEKIHDMLANWDFKSHGKITQYSVRKNFKLSPKTVTKYWNTVLHHIERLNSEFDQYRCIADESYYEIYYEYEITNFEFDAMVLTSEQSHQP